MREPHQHGVIVICDIVAFSEKTEGEQVACVRFLDQALKKVRQGARLGRRLDRLYVNCTGDGFLAALPFSGREDARSACLKMAEEIVKATRRYSPGGGRPSLHVRFGLHRGDYIEGVNAFGRSHTIGNGPNRASRVASVGDASQIVVSAEFLHGYEENRAAFIGPYTVPIKHNDEADVFLYRGSSASSSISTDHQELPRRIFLLNRVDSSIDREITGMLEVVEQELAIPRQELRLRVSVFLPNRSGSLYCAYRRKSGDNKGRGGETTYKVKPLPEGVLGVAFATKRIVIETDLPPKTNLDEYVGWWLKRPQYNLAKTDVENWSRHPQALIGIPFESGADEKHDLRGVLCVDTRHPLSSVGRSKIEGSAEALRLMANERLAWKILLARSV